MHPRESTFCATGADEATPKGLDIRYVVTNLTGGSAEWLYETLYCARGQMEKLHQAAQNPVG
jgi:hypothetical protein